MPQNANGVAQRIAHAQGFPSQLPAEVATPVATASPVVIGGSRPAMVSASATKLLVFPLKANGDFDGECLQYDLPADRVQAVAVSQKAQRVYAAVKPEVKPE
jgi:hypothetical protein